MLLRRQSLFLPRLVFFFAFLKSSYIFLFSFTYYNEIRFLPMIYLHDVPASLGQREYKKCSVFYHIHVRPRRTTTLGREPYFN